MDKDPNSPCFSCQWYRKMDCIENRWVFVLPNQGEFASCEDEHAWCLIEVLDRVPAHLEKAAPCPFWEIRAGEKVVVDYTKLKALHPAYR